MTKSQLIDELMERIRDNIRTGLGELGEREIWLDPSTRGLFENFADNLADCED